MNRTERARRGLLAGVCAIGVVITLIAVLYASSSGQASAGAGGSGTGSAGIGSGPGAPSLGDVQRLLDRHAAAVLSHDRGRFMADVDPEPSAHELWLTFVNRSGHVRLAADSDLVDAGGVSWHGPWDFGPIEVYRGRYSLVLAHPSHADVMPTLASAVDRSVPAVTKVWGTGWNQQIALVVPDSQAEMNQVLDSTLPLSRIAATTYVDSVDAGTGRAIGVRVVVNPANIDRFDAVGLRIVIQHEVTLVATWASRSDSSPIWLTEGFAEYVANLDTGQSVTFAAGELTRDVRAGTIPAALPTAAAFSSEQTRLPQVYEEAWLACRLIAEKAGQPGLVNLLRQVGASDAGADRGVETALQSVLHMSTAQFTTAWQQYLKAKLGQ